MAKKKEEKQKIYDYIYWEGDNYDDVVEFMNKAGFKEYKLNEDNTIGIASVLGDYMNCLVGDYIIWTTNDEVYPVIENSFKTNYIKYKFR
jgi:translation elongation factor P/translation initiation factor 5A